jgi:thioredoxin reductase (NADPH)
LTEQNKYDVIIIGTGPAGLTAAIYSSWLGMKTLALEAGIVGGRAVLAPKIENFPGFEEGIRGSELVEKMKKQALRFKAEIQDSEEVLDLELNGGEKKVILRDKTYIAKAVIIATGTQRRKLHVPGETEFLGRGVSYCAVCDGPFFKKTKVAVVGNGMEAAFDALHLSDVADSVFLVSHETEQNIESTMLDKLRAKSNVEFVKGKITAIEGQQIVQKIKITQLNGMEIEKEVKGVFIVLGGVPLTQIVKKAGINVDGDGCLIVDRQQRTNVEGVFAAGDCTCGGMQAVTAAGEGAMAAMKASVSVRSVKA